MDRNILGKRLQERRLSMGLRQSKVAEKLGCTLTSLTNYERGIIKPPLDAQAKLCEIHKVFPLELLAKKCNLKIFLGALNKPVNERYYEDPVFCILSEKQTPVGIARLEKQRENQEYINSKTGFSLTDLVALDSDSEKQNLTEGSYGIKRIAFLRAWAQCAEQR